MQRSLVSWVGTAALAFAVGMGASAVPGLGAEAQAGRMIEEKREPLRQASAIEHEAMQSFGAAFSASYTPSNLTSNGMAQLDVAESRFSEASSLWAAGRMRASYVSYRMAYEAFDAVLLEVYAGAPPQAMISELSKQADYLDQRVSATAGLIATYGTPEGQAAHATASQKASGVRQAVQNGKYAEAYNRLRVGIQQLDLAVMSTWPDGE